MPLDALLARSIMAGSGGWNEAFSAIFGGGAERTLQRPIWPKSAELALFGKSRPRESASSI